MELLLTGGTLNLEGTDAEYMWSWMLMPHLSSVKDVRAQVDQAELVEANKAMKALQR